MEHSNVVVTVALAVALVGATFVPATVGAQARTGQPAAESRQGYTALTASDCGGDPWFENGTGGKVICGREDDEKQVFPGETTWKLDNHAPGANNNSFEVYAVGFTEGIRMHWNFLGQPDFYWANCVSATDARAFGVDRGNDENGTATDKPLLDAYQSVNYTADGVYVHFYEKDTLAGNPVHIRPQDEIVARVDTCLQNPDEPGWYRSTGYINGSTKNDSKTSYNIYGASKYTYICKGCDSRKEAKEKLGPVPVTCPSNDRFQLDSKEWTCRAMNGTYYTHSSGGSGGGSQSQSTPTPTPTLTPTPTPTATATPTESDGGGQSKSTPTATRTPKQGGQNQQTQTDNQQQDQDKQSQVSQQTVHRTPTIAEGPGFGALLSLVGLLGAALLALRRD